MTPLRGKRVVVTGGSGFVGRRLVHALRLRGAEVQAPTRTEIDLTTDGAVESLRRLRPQVIYHLAADTGGVRYVSTRAMDQNDRINQIVVRAVGEIKPEVAIFTLSSCMYPKDAPIPWHEGSLIDGPMHPSVTAFGRTKRELLRHATEIRDVRLEFPVFTTIYGPGDRIADPDRAHFVGGLIGRIVGAVADGAGAVSLRGSGQSIRDILHVGDAVRVLIALGEGSLAPGGPINIGTGTGVSISWVAGVIAEAIGYRGRIDPDPSYEDGQPDKTLNTGLAETLGWVPWIRRTVEIRSAIILTAWEALHYAD